MKNLPARLRMIRAKRTALRYWATCLLVIPLSCLDHGNLFAADPYQAARIQMVRQHVQGAGVRNSRVLESMRRTQRHEFMASDQQHLAYYDMAVPIGHGQTISPPYIVAFMTEQLQPVPTDRVLEIGTGSGYQAAILSPLVKEVYTIEIVEPLGQRAAETLRRLNYTNVFPRIGDGFAGWPEHAPFDKIIVTCSPEKIPQPLVEQLAEGGQMIIPVGERFQQTLCRFRKIAGKLEREPLQATFFVPMTGESEERREVKPDPAKPAIEFGSFETRLGDTQEPEGWYYVREGRVLEMDDAPDGKHAVLFTNRVPGRSAHALQAVGIDGSVVSQLDFSLWVKAEGIRSGRGTEQTAHVIIEFYDDVRAPIGRAVVGPWTGSFVWREQEQRVSVPQDAKLAVVGVGLFGATGSIAFDKVAIHTAAATDSQLKIQPNGNSEVE